MAHELSIRANGKAEMAWVGDTPWHGLGQQVTKGASIGVWKKEAGMDWEAKEAPVLFKASVSATKSVMHKVESHKVLYRNDTEAPLGIVGRDYNVVQPADCLEFFRELTENEGWHIHTAGVLRGGRKLWVMASNGEVATTGKRGTGDQVVNQVLLATSLDGSMRTIVKQCATVVVCANTLAVALREGGKGVQVSHRSVFDPQAVARSLGLVSGSFKSFMARAREMAETPVNMEQALFVLRDVFGAPAAKSAPKVQTAWLSDSLSDLDAGADDEGDEKEARAVGRVLELFKGAGIGARLPGRVDTSWGLFNAVTQFVDHEMGRTPDTRMDSAWFGRGEVMKERALALLVADEEA